MNPIEEIKKANKFKQLSDLKEKKSYLTEERISIQRKITELGITYNAAKKYRNNKIVPHNISRDKFELREKLTGRIQEIDDTLFIFNQKIKTIENTLSYSKDLIIQQLLKEILDKDQLKEFYETVDKRLNGMTTKLKFSIQSNADETKYKTLASKFLSKIIKLRKELTTINYKNPFDTVEFMKLLSPINTELDPLTELEKIKRINNL